MADLASTGARWVSIVVTGYQSTFDSTAIVSTSQTPSDSGVAHMIDTAHALGLAVMVKPHIDLSHDPAPLARRHRPRVRSPRSGELGSPRTGRSSTTTPRLAQSHGAEEFSVGCELEGTTSEGCGVAPSRGRRAQPILGHAHVRGLARGGTAHPLVGRARRDRGGRLLPTDRLARPDARRPRRPDGSRTWPCSGRCPRPGDRPILLTEIGYVSQDGTNTRPPSRGRSDRSTCRNRPTATRPRSRPCGASPGSPGCSGGTGTPTRASAAPRTRGSLPSASPPRTSCGPGTDDPGRHERLAVPTTGGGTSIRSTGRRPGGCRCTPSDSRRWR